MSHVGGSLVNWSTTHQRARRLSLCFAIAQREGDVASGSKSAEAALRDVQWPSRNLEWHDAKIVASDEGLGFVADDLFMESSQSLESTQGLPDWRILSLPRESTLAQASDVDDQIVLVICASAESPHDEDRSDFVNQLLDCICHAYVCDYFHSMRVVLVSESRRIPLMSFPNGIQSLFISRASITVDSACGLMDTAGMLVIPDALPQEDVSVLRELVCARIHDVEQAMLQDDETKDKGIGGGAYEFCEIVHRGVQRWDMLLYRDGEILGPEHAQRDARVPVLERVAMNAPWMPIIQTYLGECKFEVGCVCSRPGACGQGWHSDGGHGRHNFDGESGHPSGLCVFVPLVPLEAHSRDAQGRVKHGRGCTAFWPGSHRYRQCPHLGAAAANHLYAAIPAAPLDAGAALIYDLRLVHCGSPNDAFHLEGVEADRPIMQFTYFFRSSRKENAYGQFQLFD